MAFLLSMISRLDPRLWTVLSIAAVCQGICSAQNGARSDWHSSADQPEVGPAPFNTLILQKISQMPKGGGYSTGRVAKDQLQASILPLPAHRRFSIHAASAQPSFCSGATYLVFTSLVNTLLEQGRLVLSSQAVAAIANLNQDDGYGVWGRWNANGPGTARLFYELGAGENFSDFEQARPGDFMKIWWNDYVGAKEFGHSVIYLGRDKPAGGEESVRFWSSNQSVGYGEKTVPRSKIRRALFSRFQHLEALTKVAALPKRDDYLAEMLRRNSGEAELAALTGAGQTLAPSLAMPLIQPLAAVAVSVEAGKANPSVFQQSRYANYSATKQTELLLLLQAKLSALGLLTGRIDGIPGPKTMSAVEALQKQHGRTPSGTIDDATLKDLGLGDLQ
ncbi:MAG: hypothetical protein JWO94_315 [Verrucomicrobiaceae bacterium]|nr:hypothetical protein [Verrucomicrobiaceae bacterium]